MILNKCILDTICLNTAAKPYKMLIIINNSLMLSWRRFDIFAQIIF